MIIRQHATKCKEMGVEQLEKMIEEEEKKIGWLVSEEKHLRREQQELWQSLERQQKI